MSNHTRFWHGKQSNVAHLAWLGMGFGLGVLASGVVKAFISKMAGE